MKSIDWQLATPQHDQVIDSSLSLFKYQEAPFVSLQPRLDASLKRFVALADDAPLLAINGSDTVSVKKDVASILSQLTQKSVHHTESIVAEELLGSYIVTDSGDVQSSVGLFEKHSNGYLIISANAVLSQPTTLLAIRALLAGEDVARVAASKNGFSPKQRFKSAVKLIIVGDRNQLADLDYLDPAFSSSHTMFTEVEMDVRVDTTTAPLYLGYIVSLVREAGLPDMSSDAIHSFLTAGARVCEEQHFAPLSASWIRALLREAALESNAETIEAKHIDAALEARYYRESYLPNRALDDILDGQVLIQTQGNEVGQVNGLTVIDIPGHPVSYGEPARISCVIHFGDGDVSDVERKAELGGNLHAKGMMIMQAFLSSALNLDEPLPYSASIVFEQSYSEVDGDSASLAELCAFVSALSGYEIKQNIAVTGAVDQFGRVQAVGGLNEKIEGFFYVCAHQGLTGDQGVILPKSNLRHLSLHKDVVDAIKQGKFHIWSVEDVNQALPIITGQAFSGESDDTILNKIAERIDRLNQHDISESLLNRLKRVLFRD
ncbi:S16 family serine protease [Vibrio breoganii]|uniref:endopeptidase La n=1 Tax=Vibrio breoganii TaxID=553239 RepID=A0AAP8MVU7_9VIBR|nr:Lon protease family protein [Vibrio breoganii]OCH76544.1 ATP-dependent protease [Vibrio breoganii]PMP03249.1 ATP-dependent protease [Vibrio breoganii]PMP05354.1 ATP-dependent protease [Vibrio breoganii]PMP10129.1 ATP-dependent protease [Vibrio breoganii]